MSLDEFDIVNQFFVRQNRRKDVLQGIGDDCAILHPPKNKNLIVTTDTLNLGSHFFPDSKPCDIGYKSVAVSLSDVAAMGGEPAWLLLSLTLPEIDSAWLADFAQGLFTCLDLFDVALVGGNTSRGPLAITTQALGWVDMDSSMMRARAKPGDLIFVTGHIGDAALALAIITQQISSTLFSADEITALHHQLFQPTPRIEIGKKIRRLAHAAIDISDGLIADLGHILANSQVGATIKLASLPFSSSLNKLPPATRYELALAGGDDYELCFTLPVKNLSLLEKIIPQFDCKVTNIGKIEQSLQLRLEQQDGTEFFFNKSTGYKHF